MTIDKAQETKLQSRDKNTKVSGSVFSADISKSEDISRWRPIDQTLHYDFSATAATGMFFKNRHNFYQKDSRSFQQWVQQEAKQSILQDYEVTDTHKPIALTTNKNILDLHSPHGVQTRV